MKNLEKLQNFVNEMKDTSSLNNKKDILKQVENDIFITSALSYTYNPYLQYNVSGKNCMKNIGLGASKTLTDEKGIFNIFDLLDALSTRSATGHDAIKLVNSFILKYGEQGKYSKLIYSIIDKNLEIRASESVINKVIPGLIPSFKVALASNYEPKLVDFENETWFSSRKLDGVRCIIKVDAKGKAKAYSRQGKEFETLGKVIQDIEEFGQKDLVFDGELCLIDENGNDDFQGIMKQIRRKDHTIENPKFKIFDVLPVEDFENQAGTFILADRLAALQEMKYFFTGTCLSVLHQEVVRDEDHFAELNADAKEKGYEGIMLRKNVGYEGKRSKTLLKVKSFFDAEYKVIDIDFKDHRIIQGGKEIVRPMMAQVYIEHKGYRVGVGSGFNQDERIKYYENPKELIGKLITVQYFEETTNQQGGLSLRFPTVKHIYENDRDC